MIYIYGLLCPIAGAVRYIGKAKNPTRRLTRHLATAKRNRTYKDHWLLGLIAAGKVPTLIILRELADDEDWSAAERAEIARARREGLPLTNLTEGGDGGALNEEGLSRLRKALVDPSRCQKISQGRKRFLADPAERKKVADNNRRRGLDPEARAKQSAALKAYRADPERSKHHAATLASPEYRKKRSEIIKRRWADPAYKARMAEAHRESWRRRKEGQA